MKDRKNSDRTMWKTKRMRQETLYHWEFMDQFPDRVEMGMDWFDTDECWEIDIETAARSAKYAAEQKIKDDAMKAREAARKAEREAKKAAKKQAKADELERELAEGISGECQICGRHQVVKPTLVNHGYRRPGWGFITAGCPGTRHLPFPQVDALEAIIPDLEKHIVNSIARSKAETVVFTEKVNTHEYDYNRRKYIYTYHKIANVDDYLELYDDADEDKLRADYAEAVRLYRLSQVREAEATEKEIVRVEARIAEGLRLQGEA